jgi:hypothetical protein
MKRYKDTEYFITEDGKVFRDNKELKIYRGVYSTLKLSVNNVSKTNSVHRLVAETYISNPENKPEVNHWDGNTHNNHVSNLRWSTRVENIKHKHDILNKSNGENHGQSKLKKTDVDWIRNNYVPKHKQFGMNALARKYNIATATIHSIIHNKTWIHP